MIVFFDRKTHLIGNFIEYFKRGKDFTLLIAVAFQKSFSNWRVFFYYFVYFCKYFFKVLNVYLFFLQS